MGVDERDARTGVRFSLGWASDEADVAHALAAVAPAVARLRGAA
jgi:cysteine sulfinate desulfinase/cysteine desulfurase-like protein